MSTKSSGGGGGNGKPVMPLVAVCRLCREIVHGRAMPPAGLPGIKPEDMLQVMFSQAFGEHMVKRHPKVMQDLQHILVRASAAAASAAGWHALSYAESTDQEFLAWRERDAQEIRASLDRIAGLVNAGLVPKSDMPVAAESAEPA